MYIYLAVLHYDIQCRMVSVNDAVVVAYNMRMSQFTKQVHLLHQQLLLLLTHPSIVHLLPYIHLRWKSGGCEVRAVYEGKREGENGKTRLP